MELAKIRTKGADGMSPVQSFAASYLTILLQKQTGIQAKITLVSDTEAYVFVHADDAGVLIGKGGENITALEERWGMKISVKTQEDSDVL